MFSLDNSTIRLCATIVVVVTLLSLFAFWGFKNFKANANWWIAGIVVYSVAFLGTLYGTVLPGRLLFAVPVETGLIVSGLLFLNAVRVKLNKPPLIKTLLALAVTAMLGSAWFIFVTPNALVRNQSIFLVTSALTLLAAWEMLRNATGNKQKPYFACAFLFLSDGLFNSGCFLYFQFSDSISIDFITLLFLFTTILIALLNHAFILMAYDDLRQDLDWAMQQLRKESEQKLQSVQDRWLLALDYGKSGAWEVDMQTAEIVMSPHWTGMLGLPMQELRTTTADIMQYMHPDDLDSFLRNMKDLELGHSDFLEHEHRLRRANGSWIWVCSRARNIPQPEKHGEPKLVGIDIDITDTKLRQVQLEQAIAASEQAREVALQASKAKTIFLTNISHEIRTPMNAILGFSQLLLDDKRLHDDQKESLEIITSSGVHLMSLIDDILNLSRIQSGHFTIRREIINPLPLFQEISGYFQKRIVRDGVQFETSLTTGLPRSLQLDPKAIRQICINLLSNAFKYTEKGKVVLKVDYLPDSEPLHGTLVIEVSDTGVGIREEHLGLIFNVFEQAGSAVFTDEGVGLGLTICKDIVSHMEGKLEVKSRPREGSCFTVTIPVEEAGIQVVAAQGATARQPQAAPAILIVDDIESNRKLLQRILGDKGYEILEANNALDAIALIRARKPALVLMDIRMPIIAGDEAILRIRADPELAAVPIIAITANAFEGEKERLLAVGANDFISKPFMRDEILARISKVLVPPTLAAPAHLHIQAANEVPVEPPTLKVMVVDDNPANQQLLMAQLRTMGLQAEPARNGREAFNSWNLQHHDVVLTDCAMPLLDGFALARLIRQTEADEGRIKPTLIIAVTGSPEEYSERCLESGMNDLMGKPVLLRVLSKTLARHLPAMRSPS